MPVSAYKSDDEECNQILKSLINEWKSRDGIWPCAAEELRLSQMVRYLYE